jgi:hypothetical protein
VQYYPEMCKHFQVSYIIMLCGSQLIFYDGLGSLISDYILNKSDPILSVTYLTSLSHQNNFIKKYVGSQTISALIIGENCYD